MKKFIISVLLISFLVFFRVGFVSGNSMKPTLNNYDFVLVSKYSFPSINDIVVANYNNSKIIKRVIACNGEYINEKYNLDEKYLSYIPLDKYFLLGDNINESIDSRQFGYIDKNQIIGVVIFHCNSIVFILFIILILLGVIKWLK